MRNGFASAMRKVKRGDLPLSALVSKQSVRRACSEEGYRSQASLYTPITTILTFVAQLLNADGSCQQVTEGGPNFNWSPDGSRIAFERQTDTTSNLSKIYVIDADGSNEIRLMNLESRFVEPHWSPDSQQIAFQCRSDICVVNSDGSNLRNLAKGRELRGLQGRRGLFWSPDSQQIAFRCVNAICVVNSDGSNLGPLAGGRLHHCQPVVNAGKRVVDTDLQRSLASDVGLEAAEVAHCVDQVVSPLTLPDLPS